MFVKHLPGAGKSWKRDAVNTFVSVFDQDWSEPEEKLQCSSPGPVKGTSKAGSFFADIDEPESDGGAGLGPTTIMSCKKEGGLYLLMSSIPKESDVLKKKMVEISPTTFSTRGQDGQTVLGYACLKCNGGAGLQCCWTCLQPHAAAHVPPETLEAILWVKFNSQ